jgi:hypothetical protein
MYITTFQSVHRAYIETPNQIIDEPWETHAGLFLERDPSTIKEDVALFNLAKFKDLADPTKELGRTYEYKDGQRTGRYWEIANTVRRSRANLEQVTGLVLDVDKGQRIEDAISLYSGLEFVIFTTFRHTFEENRFRIIIPFSQALKSEDIALRRQSIKETFPTVDPASFNASQAFYFHSGLNDPIAYHNQGIMIDPYLFEVSAEPVKTMPTVEVTNDYQDVEEIIRELKRYYPDLENQVRMRVTWAVQSSLGSEQTVSLMRSYYPDWDKTQKYESWCQTFRQGSIHLGTVVEMIRRHDPGFRRQNSHQLLLNQIGEKIKKSEFKIKSFRL